MQKNILYIVIGVLFAIIILQRCSNSGVKTVEKVKIDTVVQVIHIHDTVEGKPIYIKGGQVIKWKDSLVYRPDTNYDRLLAQYMQLGDKYFSEHIYKTKFPLGSYGFATVTDTIVSNQITHNGIVYSIDVPEKVVTKVVNAPSKRQIYVGLGLVGNPKIPVAGGSVGGLYKDRKDRIFGANVGSYNGIVYYGLSSYWKIKF